MENATKALLISAAVMIAIMVLSLLMMAYNQVSDYYQTQHTDAMAKQTEEFNNKFINYDRDNIRGSDLLSLMNKVIDFNERYSYTEGTDYKGIEITIKIGSQYLDDFTYPLNSSYGMTNTTNHIKEEITNKTGGRTNREKDRELIELTGLETELIEYARPKGIELNKGKLETLSANISNILINENPINQYAESIIEKRKDVLKEILGVNDINNNQIEILKEVTYQYYQFMQFKRAYFKSSGEFEIDPDTGRICGMTFEVCTEQAEDGTTSVIFN